MARCHTKDKLPGSIGDDSKVLFLSLVSRKIGLTAVEEGFEFLKGSVHGYDVVDAASAGKGLHGFIDGIRIKNSVVGKQGLQARNVEIAEQGAGLRVDDGKMGVVVGECCEKGLVDGRGGCYGQSSRWIKVLNGGLSLFVRQSASGRKHYGWEQRDNGSPW